MYTPVNIDVKQVESVQYKYSKVIYWIRKIILKRTYRTFSNSKLYRLTPFEYDRDDSVLVLAGQYSRSHATYARRYVERVSMYWKAHKF